MSADQTIRTGQYDLDFRVTGRRHHASCYCGCQFVEGLAGRIIEISFPLNVAIAEFQVQCPAGGPVRRQLVAYEAS